MLGERKNDMTLLNDPRPISADSHAIESSEVFEGLAERFGDDAPRIVHSEGNGDWITIPNQPKRFKRSHYVFSGYFRLDYCHCLGHATSAGSMDDPEIQAYFKGGYAAMRPGLKDGSRRPDDQDIDGIAASYIRDGSRCLGKHFGPAAELLDVSQQVASKGRLVGLAALPVQQPERAHEELPNY